MTFRCGYREYTTAIICLTVVFLFADQNLLAPNLSVIAKEFHFTDEERDNLLGGQIAIGFFVIGGFISVIAGYMADLFHRVYLFGAIVFFGELSCLATYWSRTYLELYFCRILTGISIGGATPIVFSLLGDLYSSDSRVNVSTFVGVSMSFGIALGQVMAGFLGPSYGWRFPFLLVAIPALFFALLILLTGYEPERGSSEEEFQLMRNTLISQQIDQGHGHGHGHGSLLPHRQYTADSYQHKLMLPYTVDTPHNQSVSTSKNSIHDHHSVTIYDDKNDSITQNKRSISKHSKNSMKRKSSSSSSSSTPMEPVSFTQRPTFLDYLYQWTDHLLFPLTRQKDTSSTHVKDIHTYTDMSEPLFQPTSSPPTSPNMKKYNNALGNTGVPSSSLSSYQGITSINPTSAVLGNRVRKPVNADYSPLPYNDDDHPHDDNNNNEEEFHSPHINEIQQQDSTVLSIFPHNTNSQKEEEEHKEMGYNQSSPDDRDNKEISSYQSSTTSSSSSSSSTTSVKSSCTLHDSISRDRNDTMILHYQSHEEVDKSNASHHSNHSTNPNIHNSLSKQNTQSHGQNTQSHGYPPSPSQSQSLSQSVDTISYSEKIDCTKVYALLSNRSAVLVFMQGIPACLPWGMVYTFLNDYFSADKGLSIMQATLALASFGLGGLVGQFIGGIWGQYLYNQQKYYQCYLMGFSTILSVFPMLYMLNTSHPGDVWFFLASLFCGFVVSMNGPNVRSVLQNVCTPEVRGTAFAVFNLTDDLGKGAGPVLVVALIKACRQDRQLAFSIVTLFWIVGGLVLLLLTCTVHDDERIVQEHVRSAIVKSLGVTCHERPPPLQNRSLYDVSQNPIHAHSSYQSDPSLIPVSHPATTTSTPSSSYMIVPQCVPYVSADSFINEERYVINHDNESPSLVHVPTTTAAYAMTLPTHNTSTSTTSTNAATTTIDHTTHGSSIHDTALIPSTTYLHLTATISVSPSTTTTTNIPYSLTYISQGRNVAADIPVSAHIQ